MARSLRCPRDGAEAYLHRQRGRFGRFEIEVCPECAGVWFDRGEIAKVSGDKEIERLIVLYAGGPSGLSCPRCGKEMARRPVFQMVLDVCPSCHGVWADGGDLEYTVKALQKDGLIGASEPPVQTRDIAFLTFRSAIVAESIRSSGPTPARDRRP